jgi:uncharacterized protein (DUF4415 family)
MTGKQRALGSNLNKVDAHVIRPEEYEEAPEWTDEMLDRADLMDGDRVIRRGKRGRPRLDAPKEQVTLRIDHDVLEGYRATGQGWQSRINEALRKSLEQMKRLASEHQETPQKRV